MDGKSNVEFCYKEIKPYQCGKCLNSFTTQNKLKFHTELVHAKGLHQCAKCDFSCKGIGQITLHNQNHIRERHLKTYKATKSIENQKFHENNYVQNSCENATFYTQGSSSDCSYEVNKYVPYNDNFQIEDIYNNDKQSKINATIEIDKQNINDAVTSSNTDLDFIGFENGNNNDNQSKIKATIKIDKHNINDAVTSSNTDSDFIGFENGNLEIKNARQGAKYSKTDFKRNAYINQSKCNVASSDLITNSDFIDEKLEKKEKIKYVKASGYICNKNIKIDEQIKENNFILEVSKSENIHNLARKMDKLEPMASFIDLINETVQTSLKCSHENSQRETESKHIYTKNNSEEQIKSTNTNLEKLMNNEINVNNLLVETTCKKINLKPHTGITNEVKKLMLKVQTIDNQLQCPECKKLYKTSGLVKRHLLIHTGEKPFKCTKCYSAFNQNIRLQRHMKEIHNGGLFKCMYCDETFVQKIHLNRHNIEHKGIYPFSCKICSKKFLLERDVRKHMKDEHIYNTIEWVNAAKPNNEKISETENKADSVVKLNYKNEYNLKANRLKVKEKSSKRENDYRKYCEQYGSCANKIKNKSMKDFDKLRTPSPSKSPDTHTSSLKQSIYKCNYCGETFQNIITFNSHLKIHEVDSDSDFSLPDINI